MVLLVIEVYLDFLVLLGLWDLEAHLDLKGKEETRDLLEKRVHLDLQDPKDHQVHWVPEVKGVRKVHLVNKELLEWEADLVIRVLLGLLVQLALLDHLDFLVLLVKLVLLETLEERRKRIKWTTWNDGTSWLNWKTWTSWSSGHSWRTRTIWTQGI